MMGREMSGLQILKLLVGAAVLGGILWLLYQIRSTLVPFAAAFLFAYVLGPIADRMESQGVKRIAAVAILYVVILILGFSASLYLVPFLVDEFQDLGSKIAGEKIDWTFTISNIGGQDLTVDRIEVSKSAGLTLIDPPDFPVVVAPFKEAQVTVRFSPLTAKPVRSELRIYSDDPKHLDDPVSIWLEANRPHSAMPREHTALQWASNAYWPVIAVSDTARYLGEVQPSYAAKLRDRIRALQPELTSMLPILQNADLAAEMDRWGSAMSTSLVKRTPELIGGLISGLTFAVIVPFVAFFLLTEGRALKRRLIALVPNRHFELVLNLFYRIDQQLGGFIRAIIIYSFIVAGLSMFGLWLIGLRYCVAVGIFAGLASLIPYFGAVMGVVAGSLAAILQHQAPEAAIPVVAVFLVIHLLDGVFISPLVMARNVDLHPIAIIFVLLIGGQIFGALGMFIAVPVAAVIKVSTRTIYEGLKSYSV